MVLQGHKVGASGPATATFLAPGQAGLEVEIGMAPGKGT